MLVQRCGLSFATSAKRLPVFSILVFYVAPWVLGIWGEWLFLFRELGSTGNYFRGSGEQAHSFGDLGSSVKK